VDLRRASAHHDRLTQARANRAGQERKKRLFASIIGAIMALAAYPTHAAWPERPIAPIVPFAAGGGTDGVARIMAEHFGRNLGHAVVIENRGGANGNKSAVAAARAMPDGYSFFFTTGTAQAINPALYRRLPYDPVRDFTPIGRIGIFPLMLAVHPGVKAETISAFIAALKAESGKFSLGHWSAVYLAAGKSFVRQIGAEVLDVPYRSSANTMTDLVAGRISFAIVDLTIGIPLARANELRPLAVTGAARSALLPNLPNSRKLALLVLTWPPGWAFIPPPIPWPRRCAAWKQPWRGCSWIGPWWSGFRRLALNLCPAMRRNRPAVTRLKTPAGRR